MRAFVIALVAVFALMATPVANAGWFGDDDEQTTNVTATADTDVDVDVDTEVGNGFGNFSPSAKGYGGDARAYGGDSDQVQGQMQGFSDDDVTITKVDADNSEGLAEAGKELRRGMERHSESAARATANSMPNMTPCGDTTGMSAQTGLAGASMATVPEVCRAYRLQLLRNSEEEVSFSTTLATITHYVGWFPRLVLHVGSLGVLN